MNEAKHHLVLGEMEDFLTGEMIEDNHDERLRQGLARFLVDRKGYEKADLTAKVPLVARAGDKKALLKIDFCVRIRDKVVMVVKYGPGSLVTRVRPALAVSRLLERYQIPLLVVSNGIDAELLDGASGKVLGNDLSAIPDKKEIVARFDGFVFNPIPENRAEMESRILYAYEIDDACPCDGNVCKL
jgi:hypothetical protein